MKKRRKIGLILASLMIVYVGSSFYRIWQSEKERIRQNQNLNQIEMLEDVGFGKDKLAEVSCFPVACQMAYRQDGKTGWLEEELQESFNQCFSYEDSFGDARNYGGDRQHEGCDIMAIDGRSGYYPVVSMTDGVIDKVGWLELGGYRVGVRSPSGVYYYYAHLASYGEDIKEGKEISAGELLGFLGDSGYGEEGTTGQFPAHLHLGVYVPQAQKEQDEKGENNVVQGEKAIDPYPLLQYAEKYKISFVELDNEE